MKKINDNLMKKEIGERIDFIRKQKNMSKDKFAQLINITGQHLGKVLTGENGLSVEKIIELAEKTNYSTDFILLGKKDTLEQLLRKLELDVKHAHDEIKNINSLLDNK